MGKNTGFLDIRRKTGKKEPVKKRLKHFGEFYQQLSHEQLLEQAARCMNCGTPFCHAYGCPLGNYIPEWNDLVYRGRWKEAAGRLHLTNNLPEVTGRICPALCEASCVAAIDGDAVTIRDLELAVVEKAWDEGWIQPQPPAEETGRKIAIVGSGPAGLSAAQQLRRAGHTVDVYEKAPKPGGIMRYGIPDYKLEKWVIDRRLDQMKAEGVNFQCDIDAGMDISANYLRKKYDAIGLSIGAGIPRDLSILGRDAGGIHFAMDYLIQQNRRNDGETIPDDEAIWAEGKKVVVIGGGDTSNDCMGVALRQGAASVQQLEIMPEPPGSRDPESTPWPMWPYMLRTSTSHEEGGGRTWAVNTREFLVRDGTVAGIRCEQVEWKKDAKSGRMTFQPVKGSRFTLDADLVILAMGFTQPKHDGLLDSLGVAYDRRGNVRVDSETMMTSVPGVFAAGDVQTGAWLIVGAITGGRRMARRIDLHLMGETSLPEADFAETVMV